MTFLSDNRADLAAVDDADARAPVLRGRDRAARGRRVRPPTAPRQRARLLEATGHCPNLSAPEETIAAIREFLWPARHDPGSRRTPRRPRTTRRCSRRTRRSSTRTRPAGYLSSMPDGDDRQGERDAALVDRDTTGRSSSGAASTTCSPPGARIYYETHYAPLLQMQGSVREIAVELVRADGTRLPGARERDAQSATRRARRASSA